MLGTYLVYGLSNGFGLARQVQDERFPTDACRLPRQYGRRNMPAADTDTGMLLSWLWQYVGAAMLDRSAWWQSRHGTVSKYAAGCSMQGGHLSHLRLIARICSPKPGIMRVHTCVSCASDHCSDADAVCYALILGFVPACSLTLRGGHAWTGATSGSRQSHHRFCGLWCHVPRRWACAACGDHHAAAL